jgi:hypothetical protein
VSAQAAAIARYCAEHPAAASWDEATGTLRDSYSQKTLRLELARVARMEARTAKDTLEPYLAILLDDGRQLALAPAGIAFPPDLRNAGALPGLPQVLCWRDFAQALQAIEHALYEHPDAEPNRELLDLVRFGIALVDGARGAGFEVGEEERRLERALAEIERRSKR